MKRRDYPGIGRAHLVLLLGINLGCNALTGVNDLQVVENEQVSDEASSDGSDSLSDATDGGTETAGSDATESTDALATDDVEPTEEVGPGEPTDGADPDVSNTDVDASVPAPPDSSTGTDVETTDPPPDVTDVQSTDPPPDVSDAQVTDPPPDVTDVTATDPPPDVSDAQVTDPPPDPCPSGEELCGASCVNTNDDPEHCGGCTTPCPAVTNATPTCSSASCSFSCEAGFDDCDTIASTGCEAELAVDPDNCGACDVACGSGEVCVDGSCGIGVRCGNAVCNVSSDRCCLGTGDGTCGSGACGTNETPVTCDGPEDCPGLLCCGNYDVVKSRFTDLACTDLPCIGGNVFIICDPDGPDQCATTDVCAPHPDLPSGYWACQ